MATFIEIDREVIEDITTTTIEITYGKEEFKPVKDNDVVITIDINHFKPQTEDDILLGINNRIITEKRNL